MPTGFFNTQLLIFRLLACALILRVTVSVLSNYYLYLPPNFETGFLQDRESYFYGSYQCAFYVHIASGPCTLVFGMILVSEAFRRRYARWHRYLGRIQVGCVLLLMAPSGLWLAFFAHTGLTAKAGFATLAVATGFTIWQGFRSAAKHNFVAHRRWMWRCFMLLCSAVVLRIIGGLATLTEINGELSYTFASWASWLMPLAAYEVTRKKSLASKRKPSQAELPRC